MTLCTSPSMHRPRGPSPCATLNLVSALSCVYFSKVIEAVVVSCGPCGDITAKSPWRCHIKAASNSLAIGRAPPICIEDWIALGPWVAPFARPMRSSQHTSNTGAFKADFKGVAFKLACSRRKPRCIDAASVRKRVSRPHLELAGETDVRITGGVNVFVGTTVVLT
jgi:hypothetical protein